MIVDRVTAHERDGWVERSARVRWSDGETQLRIDVPSELAAGPEDASPYLAAVLQLAMRRHEDLEVDAPVSPWLLARCDEIQEIYASWNPELKRCRVTAAAQVEPTRDGKLAGSFFSRGVDSTYCAVAERDDPLEVLVFCDGLEPRHDEQVRAEEIRLAGVVAERVGLPLVTTDTNLRELADPLLRDWEDYVAPALAFVAHSLAGGLRVAVIPSTDSYASVEPCGTGPLLDPLFSTEAVEIKHDSLARGHGAKVAWLAAQRPELIRLLKVCFVENRPDNCGRCGKCIVTMAELRAAGALEQAELFPDEIDLDAFSRIHIWWRKSRLDFEWVRQALGSSPADGRLREAIGRAIDEGARELGEMVREGRHEPLSFREHHLTSFISTLGGPGGPVSDPGGGQSPAGEPPAGGRDIGLVRMLDVTEGRHLYRAGQMSRDLLVGELGSLHSGARAGSIPLFLADGRASTSVYAPSLARPELRARLTWTLAPLGWRDCDGLAARAGAVGWRVRRLATLRRIQQPPSTANDPAGFLHERAAEGRLPLYSAVHPITGDQLLATSQWEAVDLGYAGVTLLGYLDARAPVTGQLGTGRPHLSWASRFGQRVRPG